MSRFLASHPSATQAAVQDLSKQYSNSQPAPGQNVSDPKSRYLSLLIGVLSQQADLAVLGNERTDALLRLWTGNQNDWTAQTVVKDARRLKPF
jgi:hypothetical protein